MAEARSRLVALASERGLAFRGAFHPESDDRVPPLPGGAPVLTLALIGFIGGRSWSAFAASPEAIDGRPDPLDRWSRRLIDGLAATLGALALYPFEGPGFLPFQRWARKAEPVYPSPLGILIHPDWGLWHGYRGALAFADRLDVPARDNRANPCENCAEKPCLSTCPVDAFSRSGYDVATCAAHISASAGADCVDRGCRARRACPIGAAHRYGPAQSSFHMHAFRAARRR